MEDKYGHFTEYLQILANESIDNKEHFAIFLDTETTGLNPWVDQIVEISIALFSYSQAEMKITNIVQIYTGLREPTIPISPGARSVHNIKDSDVKGKSLNDAKILELFEKADFIIAHNIKFDRTLVSKMYSCYYNKIWLCSCNDIPWKTLGFDSRKLQYLLNAHNITPSCAHRAESDVSSAIELLKKENKKSGTYFKILLMKYLEYLVITEQTKLEGERIVRKRGRPKK